MSSTEQQPINLNEKEIELIQRTFKGNEDLLKSIRALFLGLTVTDTEKETIRTTFALDELRAIMRRRFYPTLDRDTAIGQVQDVWLGVEQMVFGNSRDAIYQAVHYKAQALKMTEQALKLLIDPSGTQVDLTYDPQGSAVDDLQVFLLARNQYIRHVEQQLLFLKIIAEQPAPSKDTVAKARKKNSAE